MFQVSPVCFRSLVMWVTPTCMIRALFELMGVGSITSHQGSSHLPRLPERLTPVSLSLCSFDWQPQVPGAKQNTSTDTYRGG